MIVVVIVIGLMILLAVAMLLIAVMVMSVLSRWRAAGNVSYHTLLLIDRLIGGLIDISRNRSSRF